MLVLLLFALPACGQMDPRKDFAITAAECDQVIKGSIAKLNESYVYPDVARKMGQAIAARWPAS